MNAPDPPSIVLFDGVCNLCNGSVQFILKRDRAGRFRFASLQSEAARRLLDRHGARPAGGPERPEPHLDSLVLAEGGRIFERSTAVLRIARGLPAPWPLAYAAIVVPRPLRDWVYDRIARNRYRWFGRRESCMVPTPDARSRFLE